jgi:hypothetical protein
MAPSHCVDIGGRRLRHSAWGRTFAQAT